MKKILFLLLLALSVIVIAGCVPVQPGTSREGALAGKAVELSRTTTAVDSCSQLDTGVSVTSSKVSSTLANSCDDSANQGTNYVCIDGGSYATAIVQCEGEEVCSNGYCVAPASATCEAGCQGVELIDRELGVNNVTGESECQLTPLASRSFFSNDGEDFTRRYGRADCRSSISSSLHRDGDFLRVGRSSSRATCDGDVNAENYGCAPCGSTICVNPVDPDGYRSYYEGDCQFGTTPIGTVECDGISLLTTACSDTDPENLVGIRGQLSQEFADGSVFLYSDICQFPSPGSSLYQGSCVGNEIEWTLERCPSGTTCSEGACV